MIVLLFIVFIRKCKHRFVPLEFICARFIFKTLTVVLNLFLASCGAIFGTQHCKILKFNQVRKLEVEEHHNKSVVNLLINTLSPYQRRNTTLPASLTDWNSNSLQTPADGLAS